MAASMRSKDWSTSPLGAPETWDRALRTTVSLMLASKFPMFIAWGPELGLLYNDPYAQILGDKHPQALGSRFADVWREIWTDILPFIDAALAGEASWLENLPLLMNRHGYDEETYFTFSYSPAMDERGEIVGMFCVCTETTAQVRAERAVRESEARFRNMADNSPVMMWVTDPTGYCTYLNKQWYDFTGQSAAEGEGFGWLDATHPDDRAEAERAFIEANERRAPFRVDYRLRRADGVYRWAIDTAAPRFDEEGAYLGYVGSVIDIDERREAEQHLRLMVNELNHRVKNSLATVQAIASHTFRKPESFEQAKAEFTARILALAKAHDVLTEASWAGADLNEVVQRTVDPHHGKRHGRFKVDGPSVVLAPKSALSLAMALHELCTNAVKYGALSTDTGFVEIAWSIRPEGTVRYLKLSWREVGGPSVTVPTRKGFGSRLIEFGLAAELNGTAQIAYEPTGVVCIIEAPLPAA